MSSVSSISYSLVSSVSIIGGVGCASGIDSISGVVIVNIGISNTSAISCNGVSSSSCSDSCGDSCGLCNGSDSSNSNNSTRSWSSNGERCTTSMSVGIYILPLRATAAVLWEQK